MQLSEAPNQKLRLGTSMKSLKIRYVKLRSNQRPPLSFWVKPERPAIRSIEWGEVIAGRREELERLEDEVARDAVR